MLEETSYGFRRRLEFAAGAIEEGAARSVLDLGCGSGAFLLGPLARRFPGVQFTGVDSDATSIEAARRELDMPNVRLHLSGEDPPQARYDLVIASEVLEHVAAPHAFLAEAAARVTEERGRLLLTVPNGFGAAEWAAFTEGWLRLSGIYRLLQATKRAMVPAAQGGARDSYAVSPHVNFFTHGEVMRLAESAGFRLLRYRPRSVLCGFGWDLLVRGARLTEWNQALAERLPPALAADWMFLFHRAGAVASSAPASPPGRYTRLRRWMTRQLAARR